MMIQFREFVSVLLVGSSAALPLSGASADFLEADVQVLYEVGGENSGDTFGFVVEPVGDLNADGASEFLASAPYHRVDAVSLGKVYLMDGATGSILRTHVGSTPGGRFGFRLAAMGDVDADGTPDYAAGAPGDEGTAIDGEFFVFSGDLGLSESASLLWHQPSAVAGARLGRGLGAAGDLDGDGHDDVLAGAPREAGAGTDSGTVYVFSGRTHGILRVHEGAAGDRLGQACRAVGPIDGDNAEEYVIAAPGAGDSDQGMAWVIRGSDGTSLHILEPDSPTAQDFGGFFANSPGDMNGDGVPDIFIGDYEDTSSGFRTGHTYLFDGATGAKFAYDVSGDSPSDWNGFGGRRLGDLDQDGSADFVTNFFHNPETIAPRAGKVVIYSGATGQPLRTITSLEGNETGSYGEWFGYDVTGLGDVNGDMIPDLLVSGALNDVNGNSTGVVYVIAGQWAASSSVTLSSNKVGALRIVSASNPFRNDPVISYELERTMTLDLDLFDSSGRRLARVPQGQRLPGRHEVMWSGIGGTTAPLPQGVFFIRLQGETESVARRLVRLED